MIISYVYCAVINQSFRCHKKWKPKLLQIGKIRDNSVSYNIWMCEEIKVNTTLQVRLQAKKPWRNPGSHTLQTGICSVHSFCNESFSFFFLFKNFLHRQSLGRKMLRDHSCPLLLDNDKYWLVGLVVERDCIRHFGEGVAVWKHDKI